MRNVEEGNTPGMTARSIVDAALARVGCDRSVLRMFTRTSRQLNGQERDDLLNRNRVLWLVRQPIGVAGLSIADIHEACEGLTTATIESGISAHGQRIKAGWARADAPLTPEECKVDLSRLRVHHSLMEWNASAAAAERALKCTQRDELVDLYRAAYLEDGVPCWTALLNRLEELAQADDPTWCERVLRKRGAA